MEEYIERKFKEEKNARVCLGSPSSKSSSSSDNQPSSHNLPPSSSSSHDQPSHDLPSPSHNHNSYEGECHHPRVNLWFSSFTNESSRRRDGDGIDEMVEWKLIRVE